MIPTREEAEELLRDGEACNPGAWADHSRAVAMCAERIAAACGAGVAVLYLVGIPYMGLTLNVYMGKGLSPATLVGLYMLPFLPFDALKIAVAALLCPRIQKSLPAAARL